MSQISESNEPMRAAIDDQTLRDWIDDAERREAALCGINRPFARAVLARNWGVPFWTLTNFRRGRLKDLRSAARARIQAGIARGIETEIQRLEHELFLVRQCGSTLSEIKISQAAAALEQARMFLKGTSAC